MLSAQPHVMIYCLVALFSWKMKVTLLGRGRGAEICILCSISISVIRVQSEFLGGEPYIV